MKIGLYFGSFNPIHVGHLIIASHILNSTDVSEVWFVISPHNPLKNAASLLNEHHRLDLVRIAIEGELRMKASSVEFKLPRPSYTIDTLTYLSEKYPRHTFQVIMGSDSFCNIKKWKNFELLLRKYSIIIYDRPGYEVPDIEGARITRLNAPLLEISSTRIRELIKENKSVRFLLTDQVRNEIERNNYYAQRSKDPAHGKTP